jgi:hypothetical protein
VILSSVIKEGNESCFRTSEHLSNITAVFVIKVYMKPYHNRLRIYYCFLLKLGMAMQEGNDNHFMVVNKEMHREKINMSQ